LCVHSRLAMCTYVYIDTSFLFMSEIYLALRKNNLSHHYNMAPDMEFLKPHSIIYNVIVRAHFYVTHLFIFEQWSKLKYSL